MGQAPTDGIHRFRISRFQRTKVATAGMTRSAKHQYTAVPYLKIFRATAGWGWYAFLK
jgi:hypothetical protein